MKPNLKKLLILYSGCGFLLVCLGSYFVFPLDVLYRSVNVVSTRVSNDGHQFSVIQWWNGSDFYSTYFLVCSINPTNGAGAFKSVVIHGDDRKLWSCRLIINEQTHEVEVRRGFRSLGTYNWDTDIYIDNGSQVPTLPGIGVWPGYGAEVRRKRDNLLKRSP